MWCAAAGKGFDAKITARLCHRSQVGIIPVLNLGSELR